ncbi:MAG: hypothetical protein E6Q25_07510 [Acinetobacter sp.]|nr:MAG: hypothetical protein E6Q25_07510 [Acinetobacter sp.]
MNIKQLAAMLFCTQYACVAWSMQPLDEIDLSETTGQDGISIGLHYPNATISYDQLMIVNKDGIAGSTTHNQTAALVIAPTTNNSTQGIRLFKTDGSVSTQQIEVHVDADGNAGAPVANLNVTLKDTTRIRINPFSIYLASGDSSIFTSRKIDTVTSNATRANVREIVKLNAHGLDAVFKDNETLGVNIQLGNAAQGAMFKLSGSLLCIANNNMCVSGAVDDGANPIELISTNGVDSNGFTTATSSVKLGLKLSATNQTTGFRLHAHTRVDDNNTPLDPLDDQVVSFGGFYGAVVDQGLVFGANGTTDKFDLTISNLTMGDAGVAGTSFNGLKNGSIGNIGMKGMTITDFKTTVKGM